MREEEQPRATHYCTGVSVHYYGRALCMYLHLGDVPDNAGRVDGGGADDIRVLLVPVERGERRAEFGVFVIVEQRLEPHALVVHHVPQPQVVASRREQVARAVRLGHPHDLCGGVGVLEAAIVDELVRLLVELHDAHRVVVPAILRRGNNKR